LNGLLDGKWTYWHENGQKSFEQNFKEKWKDGKFTFWHEDSKLYSEKIYKEGVCISGDCPD